MEDLLSGCISEACCKTICSTECISKCVECPGGCFSGLCKCFTVCCSSESCAHFFKSCGESCICTPDGWENLFDNPCCLNTESSCLSCLNCSDSISSFSSCFQSYLVFQTTRLECLLNCFPSWFLINLGYSQTYQNNYNEGGVSNPKESHKKNKKHKNESSNIPHNGDPEIIHLPTNKEMIE